MKIAILFLGAADSTGWHSDTEHLLLTLLPPHHMSWETLSMISFQVGFGVSDIVDN